MNIVQVFTSQSHQSCPQSVTWDILDMLYLKVTKRHRHHDAWAIQELFIYIKTLTPAAHYLLAKGLAKSWHILWFSPDDDKREIRSPFQSTISSVEGKVWVEWFHHYLQHLHPHHSQWGTLLCVLVHGLLRSAAPSAPLDPVIHTTHNSISRAITLDYETLRSRTTQLDSWCKNIKTQDFMDTGVRNPQLNTWCKNIKIQDSMNSGVRNLQLNIWWRNIKIWDSIE